MEPAVLRATLPELVERARVLASGDPAGAGGSARRILGITGAPGAGKSTVAHEIVTALGPELAVLVPMDGFHLANVTLHAWERRDRKGAWDTFDADGYVALLRRLRAVDEAIVHAPDFDRGVDQSIGSAIPVPREVPLVVTEGNYLLSDQGSWGGVASLLDQCWYLDIDDSTRLDRLTRRHMHYGLDAEHARAWAGGSDQTNAELVRSSRDRASLVVVVG